MTSHRLALGSAASLMLYACNSTTPVDPAANLNDNLIIDSDDQAIPSADPLRGTSRDQVSGSADQEPGMPNAEPGTTSPPDRQPVPPPAKPPAPPPRPVILPSPVQPPAEVDPVQPYPGDEVPR